MILKNLIYQPTEVTLEEEQDFNVYYLDSVFFYRDLPNSARTLFNLKIAKWGGCLIVEKNKGDADMRILSIKIPKIISEELVQRLFMIMREVGININLNGETYRRENEKMEDFILRIEKKRKEKLVIDQIKALRQSKIQQLLHSVKGGIQDVLTDFLEGGRVDNGKKAVLNS